MQNIIFSPILIITLLLGCSTSKYSPELEAEFIQGCSKNAKEADCQCWFDLMKENLSFEEFIEESKNLQTTSKMSEKLENINDEAIEKCLTIKK